MMSVMFLPDSDLAMSRDRGNFDPPSPVTTMEPSVLMEEDSLDVENEDQIMNDQTSQFDCHKSLTNAFSGNVDLGKDSGVLCDLHTTVTNAQSAKESVSLLTANGIGMDIDLASLGTHIDPSSVIKIDENGFLYVHMAEQGDGLQLSGNSTIGTISSSSQDTDGYDSVDSEEPIQEPLLSEFPAVTTNGTHLPEKNLMWSGIVLNDSVKPGIFSHVAAQPAVEKMEIVSQTDPGNGAILTVNGDHNKSTIFPLVQLKTVSDGQKSVCDGLDFKAVTGPKDLLLPPCTDTPPEQLLADDEKPLPLNGTTLRWTVDTDILQTTLPHTVNINIPDVAITEQHQLDPKKAPMNGKKSSKNGKQRKEIPIVYTCALCCQGFQQEELLEAHLPGCRKLWSFVCEKCGRGFTHKHRLAAHERTHTGQRPYNCKVCNKTFQLKCHYTVHMNIHEQKQTNCCDICGKEFAYSSNLTKHLKLHAKEKVYQCKKCTKVFHKFEALQKHMKMHTDSELYGDSVASKKFKKISDQNVNPVENKEEKPYKCLQCQHEFKLFEDVKVHMELHETNTPQTCEVCGLVFNQLWTLAHHMINDHPGSLPDLVPPDTFVMDEQQLTDFELQALKPACTNNENGVSSPADSEYADIDTIHAHNLEALSEQGQVEVTTNGQTMPFQTEESKTAKNSLSLLQRHDSVPLPIIIESPVPTVTGQIISFDQNIETDMETFLNGKESNPKLDKNKYENVRTISVEQYIEISKNGSLAESESDLENTSTSTVLKASQENGALTESELESENSSNIISISIKDIDDVVRQQYVKEENGQIVKVEYDDGEEEEDEEESSGEEDGIGVEYDSDSATPDQADSLGNGTELSEEDDYENLPDPFNHKKPYKCPECNARYKNPSSLERHLKKHMKAATQAAREMQQYECGVCGMEFKRAWKLGNHMVSEHAEEITNTDIVYSVPTRGRNAGLRKMHHPRKTSESEGKGFISTTRRTHPDPRDKLSCVLCRKIFDHQKQLTFHSAQCHQERPHRCLECGRGFKDLRDCKRHMRTHTGETPYQCSVCKRSFTQSGNLMRHMKTHAGETPFKCGICDQSFSQPSLLVSHSATHSEDERKKYNAFLMRGVADDLYVCDMCTKEFKSQGALSRHVKKKH